MSYTIAIAADACECFTDWGQSGMADRLRGDARTDLGWRVSLLRPGHETRCR
jgi:hypothetical protein